MRKNARQRQKKFQAFYKKQIKRLINDKAKIENKGQAFVTLDLSIHNGHDWDTYFLKRFWSLKDDEFEHFEVWKNDNELSTEEIADFLYEHLQPKGVMVVIKNSKHLCMEMRGVETRNTNVTTSAIRGVFKNQEVKNEFLSMI